MASVLPIVRSVTHSPERTLKERTLNERTLNERTLNERTLNERTLIIDDTAKLLGISRRTVYYRIREGRLRTVRTRGGSQRVLVSSIEALLRDTRTRQDARVSRLLSGQTRETSETKPLPL